MRLVIADPLLALIYTHQGQRRRTRYVWDAALVTVVNAENDPRSTLSVHPPIHMGARPCGAGCLRGPNWTGGGWQSLAQLALLGSRASRGAGVSAWRFWQLLAAGRTLCLVS